MLLDYEKKGSPCLVLVALLPHLILLAHPACVAHLMVVPVLITPPNVTHGGAWCRALAACNLIELERPSLGNLLCGLVLLGQLHLDQYNSIVLVILAPPEVQDGGNNRWHAIGHHNGLRCARAPLLEVDLLQFPLEESICIHLELVR